MTTQLSQLRPGTRFQLYKRHRDGSRRSPFRWGKRELAGVELRVVEVNKSYVIVSLPDGVQLPLAGSIRIKEAPSVGYGNDDGNTNRGPAGRRKRKCA